MFRSFVLLRIDIFSFLFPFNEFLFGSLKKYS